MNHFTFYVIVTQGFSSTAVNRTLHSGVYPTVPSSPYPENPTDLNPVKDELQ